MRSSARLARVLTHVDVRSTSADCHIDWKTIGKTAPAEVGKRRALEKELSRAWRRTICYKEIDVGPPGCRGRIRPVSCTRHLEKPQKKQGSRGKSESLAYRGFPYKPRSWMIECGVATSLLESWYPTPGRIETDREQSELLTEQVVSCSVQSMWASILTIGGYESAIKRRAMRRMGLFSAQGPGFLQLSLS